MDARHLLDIVALGGVGQIHPAVVRRAEQVERGALAVAVQHLLDRLDGLVVDNLLRLIHRRKPRQRLLGADKLDPWHHAVALELLLQAGIADDQANRDVIDNTGIGGVDGRLVHQLAVDVDILHRGSGIGVVHRACALTRSAVIADEEGKVKAVVHRWHHVLRARAAADQPNAGVLLVEPVVGKVLSAAVRIRNVDVGDLLVALGFGDAFQHPLHLFVHRLAETHLILGFVLPVGDACQALHVDRDVKFHKKAASFFSGSFVKTPVFAFIVAPQPPEGKRFFIQFRQNLTQIFDHFFGKIVRRGIWKSRESANLTILIRGFS